MCALVPIVMVFAKFNVVVSQVLFDIARGDTRYHERARSRAHSVYEVVTCFMCEGPRARLRDVPAKIVFCISSYFPLL